MDKTPAEDGQNIMLERPARKATLLLGSLTDDKHQTFDFRIRNISSTGLSGIIEGSMLINSVVTIDIPGIGRVTAIVTRIAGKTFGARFHTIIDPEKVRRPFDNQPPLYEVRPLHRRVISDGRPRVKNI
jgi:molybdopterin-binding protein